MTVDSWSLCKHKAIHVAACTLYVGKKSIPWKWPQRAKDKHYLWIATILLSLLH